MSNIGAEPLANEDVRRQNLAVVAQFIARHGAVARSQIADATGLSRGAVTAHAGALLEAGIIAEAAPEPSARRGRRLTKLSLSARYVAMIVLQIDADSVTAVTVDLAGAELGRASAPHGRPMGDPARVLDLGARVLGGAIEAVERAGRRVADVTVVVFAPVGGEPPIVLADSDLNWGPVDVIDALAARSHVVRAHARARRLHLVADVTVAASAEFADRGVANALYIKSDSGIGGAALVDRTLLLGVNGLAGAFGHLAVVPDGEPCACGQRGCLVTVAGPDVILREAGLGDVAARAGLTAATTQLVDAVRAGSEYAVDAWARAADWIARTLTVLALAFDPEVIVVGGFWAAFIDDLDARVARARPAMSFPGLVDVRLEAGLLGAEAALLGAIRTAQARLLADPLALA